MTCYSCGRRVFGTRCGSCGIFNKVTLVEDGQPTSQTPPPAPKRPSWWKR